MRFNMRVSTRPFSFIENESKDSIFIIFTLCPRNSGLRRLRCIVCFQGGVLRRLRSRDLKPFLEEIRTDPTFRDRILLITILNEDRRWVTFEDKRNSFYYTLFVVL
uniref:Uncharacterized protein n=1 Tax=Cacopsylla melanoneura TaxID=428564 RepID=A0A8D8LI12_9HEMI